MQQIQCCYTACQLAIEIGIGWIEHVSRVGHRSNRESSLVDSIEHRVGVAVDDSRHYKLSRRIYNACASGALQIFPHCCNLAFANEHIGVLESTLSNCEDRCIANECFCGILLSRLLSASYAEGQRNNRREQ